MIRAHHQAASSKVGLRNCVLAGQEVASRPISIFGVNAASLTNDCRDYAKPDIRLLGIRSSHGLQPARLSVLLADRGYPVDSIRKKMTVRDVLTQIRMRQSRKMRVGVDHALYSWRNLVERCLSKFKNARRIAIRYDKTAASFIDITFIRLWVRFFCQLYLVHKTDVSSNI